MNLTKKGFKLVWHLFAINLFKALSWTSFLNKFSQLSFTSQLILENSAPAKTGRLFINMQGFVKT